MSYLTPLRSFLLLAFAVAAVGCGPKNPGASPQPSDKGRLFAVSFMTLNNPFFVDLGEGIRQAVEAHGDQLVVLNAKFDALKQKNDISDVLQQEPAAIFINPADRIALKEKLVELTRNEGYRNRLGRLARERAVQVTSTRMAEGYTEVYSNLLTRRTREVAACA